VIEEILPAEVVAVDTREESLEVELFPEELAVLGRAVEKRRREFTTARACARQALARLGMAPCAIASGERGQPLWPEGLVGSITHCAGYRACALARAAVVVGVGIDAEPHAPLPEGVLGQVARAEERPRLAELARTEPAVHWDRLLFCAKEAVYKVWFPLASCWLGFEDAALTFDPVGRIFQARLLKPWPRTDAGGEETSSMAVGPGGGGPGPGGGELPQILTGRWLVRDGLVLSAITLPHTR
jgi:4'-phosphopantetheinyl transferase EntD